MICSQNKCPENRLDELLENPVLFNTQIISKHNIFVNHCYINLYNPQLYDRVKKVPNFRKKITGDSNIKDLELPESDRNMLIRY